VVEIEPKPTVLKAWVSLNNANEVWQRASQQSTFVRDCI
jgi:hypothetical protein